MAPGGGGKGRAALLTFAGQLGGGGVCESLAVGPGKRGPWRHGPAPCLNSRGGGAAPEGRCKFGSHRFSDSLLFVSLFCLLLSFYSGIFCGQRPSIYLSWLGSVQM